jgi:hypothetical protein
LKIHILVLVHHCCCPPLLFSPCVLTTQQPEKQPQVIKRKASSSNSSRKRTPGTLHMPGGLELHKLAGRQRRPPVLAGHTPGQRETECRWLEAAEASTQLAALQYHVPPTMAIHHYPQKLVRRSQIWTHMRLQNEGRSTRS